MNNREFGERLSARLLGLAVRAIRLARAMSRSTAGRHVGKQMLRAGTSAGANYEEARGAESRRDFAHKLGVVLKELREARYWIPPTRTS